jgi:glycosyltransferase involved in cell wall biosynthesis
VNRCRHEPPWDCVVSSFGPYANHLIAYKLKRAQKARLWIADYRDLWIEHHMYHGMWPFTAYEAYLESKMLREADAITTVSEPLAQVLRSKDHGICVDVIENGFDDSQLTTIDWEMHLDDSEQTVRLVFTGTFYSDYYMPEPLFEAVRQLMVARNESKFGNVQQLDLEIWFVGPTPDDITSKARLYGIEQVVRCTGFLPREQAMQIQRESHALLFFDFQAEEYKGILSGKIFEYMASGTPIWGIGKIHDNSVATMLSSSNTGVHFSDNVELIKQAIEELLDKKRRIRTAPNFEYLGQFSRSNKAKQYLNLIETLHQQLLSASHSVDMDPSANS